jgi:hypothetical protein
MTYEYYPMGRLLRMETTSERVLCTAAKLWSRFPAECGHSPVCLRVVVDRGSSSAPRPDPALREQGHFFSIIGDADNFAHADLREGFAFARLTEDVAADFEYLRYHYLEPLSYLLIAARHFTLVHASCVALHGRAILLCGESGAGKTSLAFACAQRGWTFLSGDATAIVRDRRDYSVAGRPFEIRFRGSALDLFPELASIPLITRPNGKSDFVFDPADLGLACAAEGRASHIVFLDRAARHVTASFGRVSMGVALCELEGSICFGDGRIRAEQRQALARFLSLPVLRLRYSDLASAERALRSLVS